MLFPQLFVVSNLDLSMEIHSMTGTSLFGRFALRAAAIVLSLTGFASPALHAQATPLVTGQVDETHLAKLTGNVSPKLRGAKDLGPPTSPSLRAV